MKTTSIQVAVTRSWFMEEILDDNHPILKQMWDIKQTVFINLSQEDWEFYQQLRWLDKTAYLRKITIEFINENKGKVESIMND